MSPLWDEDEDVKPAKEKSASVFFTVPAELKARIDAAAGEGKGALKRWLNGAVRFELDIQALLEPEKARLKAFAQARGLSMRDDRAKIVSGLVSTGLDSLEQKKPGKK